MYYVIDTHAFLWYLTNDSKLSLKAREIFDLIDSGRAVAILPAIVLLECIDIFDKKKIILSFDEIVLKISQANNFIVSDINLSLILEVNKIKGFNDLHDRVIVATARSFNAKLVSRDRIIRGLHEQTVW